MDGLIIFSFFKMKHEVLHAWLEDSEVGENLAETTQISHPKVGRVTLIASKKLRARFVSASSKSTPRDIFEIDLFS